MCIFWWSFLLKNIKKHIFSCSCNIKSMKKSEIERERERERERENKGQGLFNLCPRPSTFFTYSPFLWLNCKVDQKTIVCNLQAKEDHLVFVSSFCIAFKRLNHLKYWYEDISFSFTNRKLAWDNKIQKDDNCVPTRYKSGHSCEL